MTVRRALPMAFLFVVWTTTPMLAQSSEGLIQKEVDQATEDSPWKLGPFRLTPSFRLDGGYDSNGLSSADAPRDDVRLSVAPGLRTVAPLRRRAFLEVYEELDVVYYRKLEDLRDVFNVTRIGGAVGGNNLVFRLFDTFREEKARPTSEFDVPTRLRSNALDASVSIALGWRQELALAYQRSTSSVLDPVEVGEVPLASVLDRREDGYAVRLSRRLTGKTSAVLEGFFIVQDFQDDGRPRDNKSHGARGGFVFTPGTNVTGTVLVGFKRTIPDAGFQADFTGLVSSSDVTLELGQRLVLQGLFTRDVVPSILVNNWYFVENRYGGAVEVFLMERFSVRPRLVFGRNSYPRPEGILTPAGERVVGSVVDRFETYGLSFNYYLTSVWGIGVGGDYLRRESNVRSFDKERLLMTFGLRTRF